MITHGLHKFFIQLWNIHQIHKQCSERGGLGQLEMVIPNKWSNKDCLHSQPVTLAQGRKDILQIPLTQLGCTCLYVYRTVSFTVTFLCSGVLLGQGLVSTVESL